MNDMKLLLLQIFILLSPLLFVQARTGRQKFLYDGVYNLCAFGSQIGKENGIVCIFREGGILLDNGDLDRHKIADLVGIPVGSPSVTRAFDYCIPVYWRTPEKPLQERLERFHKCFFNAAKKQ